VRRNAGITLLELLIAVTLFSVLSLAMMLSMRIGISALVRTNSKLMDNRRVAGAQRVLEQQLENLIPVAAPCGADGPDSQERLPMFSGQPNSMTMVSSFSLQEAARGRAQVLQFFVIPDDTGNGVRLVVNETPYTAMLGISHMCTGAEGATEGGGRYPRFRFPTAGPATFVLADHLRGVRFEYLYISPETHEPNQPGVWIPAWTTADWPLGIRIVMAPLEPSQSRLQPITVTAPMFINRKPGARYADQ
jgi:type II secretory pathway pseudopilin PulG